MTFLSGQNEPWGIFLVLFVFKGGGKKLIFTIGENTIKAPTIIITQEDPKEQLISLEKILASTDKNFFGITSISTQIEQQIKQKKS